MSTHRRQPSITRVNPRSLESEYLIDTSEETRYSDDEETHYERTGRPPLHPDHPRRIENMTDDEIGRAHV